MEEILSENNVIDNEDRLIDELMMNYGQDILQLVYSYVNNKAIAEDVTQEIFIKCYRKLHTFNRKSKIKTWLWRIAINQCKDYLKKWYSKNVYPSDIDFTQYETKDKSVESVIIQQDEDAQLTSAVMKLPVKYREVIYLFYFEEMPINELAHVIGVNPNTVKTRLRRAKTLLKESLGGE
ncbi:RNA polymerase sigma-70 factor (ECF subfamily) [Pullulanibacillus pueri]|uniref:RNA polymerase subunit sigma n=1 Tax=Pullulanibacillus pueri TaxID=1437324 RepID=A0A8J3EM52_9BACL|nr:sigma-70 family RNA polymerase sigma factor [Pullulanibacillus pueri]MBM7680901.1 RNA polymerase sigma-70 factor (ECF subfamily) [Pullulanibacillus pueri]GGH81262.1 RNA polymerase subunit sigma [Pullulanibacillus pueri]